MQALVFLNIKKKKLKTRFLLLNSVKNDKNKHLILTQLNIVSIIQALNCFSHLLMFLINYKKTFS